MAAVYAALYGGTGVSMPYIGPWLAAHGLKGGEIAVMLSLPQLARLVTGPLLAIWADSLTLRRSAIAILAAVAAGAYLVMALTASYAIWLPVWFIASTAVNAITPLADVLTLKRARREGFQF